MSYFYTSTVGSTVIVSLTCSFFGLHWHYFLHCYTLIYSYKLIFSALTKLLKLVFLWHHHSNIYELVGEMEDLKVTIPKLDLRSSFQNTHYMKIVRIRSFSGPYFPALGLNIYVNIYMNICLSVFSPDMGKYGQEKLRIRLLSTQWLVFHNIPQVIVLRECHWQIIFEIITLLLWIKQTSVILRSQENVTINLHYVVSKLDFLKVLLDVLNVTFDSTNITLYGGHGEHDCHFLFTSLFLKLNE